MEEKRVRVGKLIMKAKVEEWYQGNKSYKPSKKIETLIQVNESTEGETLEMKVNRIVNNKEAITDGAPIIYNSRKDGVQAGYDIRTDRMEIALEALDKVTKSKVATREERYKEIEENDIGDVSIDGTK